MLALLEADELHRHALAAPKRDVLLDVGVQLDVAAARLAPDIVDPVGLRSPLEDELELHDLLAGDVNRRRIRDRGDRGHRRRLGRAGRDNSGHHRRGRGGSYHARVLDVAILT